MLKFTVKNQGADFEKWLARISKDNSIIQILHKYGKLGVEALRSATPVDTGLTANSWSYKIQNTVEGYTITWSNSNVHNGVNIAMILQYGHGTGTGGYVVGLDYINPALEPIFNGLAEEAWKEVTR